MTTPVIRPMRADEARSVGELLVRANEEHFAAFPPDVAHAYRREVADVDSRLPFSEVYVAELAGHLVGSVTYLPDASDDGHPWPPGGAVLRLLAVDPAARRQGLGEQLTVMCVDRARSTGARFLGLHTAPVMTAARRMYERLGFERAREHDFDPAAHYRGRGGNGDEPLWGLAYVLDLEQRHA